MNPLIAASFTTESKKPSKNSQCKTIILKCLGDGYLHQSDEIFNAVNEHFQKIDKKICTATIYNALNELKEHEHKIIHDHGKYKLVDSKDGGH